MSDNLIFQLDKRNLANDAISPSSGWPEIPKSSQSKASSRRNTTNHIHNRHPALRQIVRVVDGIAITLGTILSAEVENGFLTHKQAVANSVANLVAALVFFLAYRGIRLQSTNFFKAFLEQFYSLLPSIILAGAVRTDVFWWLGATEPVLLRTSGAWVMAAAGGLAATRGITIVALRHPIVQRHLTRKIAVIGSDIHAFSIAKRLRTESPNGINIVGIFADEPTKLGQFERTRVDGSVADLINLSRDIGLHSVVIALPQTDKSEKQVLQLSLRLRSVLADIFVMPYLVHGPDVVLPMQSLGSTPFLVLQRRPLDGLQMFYKRILDITLSLFSSIVLLPLFGLVSILIKIDSPGPVLFRQPRRGFNNRQFTVFKFRTMHACATDIFSLKQTSRGDPRVTRVGKWLRRLSIDELPQLLNVLRGEMSLVGPRPHALQTRVEGELLNDAINEYLIRYQVKPGITGWAQINGARGELATKEDLRRRVAFDLEYIQYWSLRFDLKIIALTAIREIFSKHAF